MTGRDRPPDNAVSPTLSAVTPRACCGTRRAVGRAHFAQRLAHMNDGSV